MIKTNWTAYRIRLVDHTIDTPHGIVAGYLAQDTGSGKTIGYIWRDDMVWQWHVRHDAHGTRIDLGAAVCVVRQVTDTSRGTTTRPLPLFDAPVVAPVVAPVKTVQKTTTHAATPVVAPTPAPKRIVWADSDFDLTQAISAGFKKAGVK